MPTAGYRQRLQRAFHQAASPLTMRGVGLLFTSSDRDSRFLLVDPVWVPTSLVLKICLDRAAECR